MDSLCRPVRRTIATLNCTFKMDESPWPDRATLTLRDLAAWMGEALSVYRWEARALREALWTPSGSSRRPDRETPTATSFDDMPVLAFEAASCTRRVLDDRPPSVLPTLAGLCG